MKTLNFLNRIYILLLLNFIFSDLKATDNVNVSFNLSNYVGYNISCYGGSNGSIDAIVTGGHPPYTFSWSNSATTQNISDLVAGDYILSMYDTTSALAFRDTVTLVQPDSLYLIFQPSTFGAYNVTRHGYEVGTIDVQFYGGTPPYFTAWVSSTSWINGMGLLPAQEVGAGSYNLEIWDANDCYSLSQPIVLTEPDAMHIASISTKSTTCHGGNDGQAYVAVSGGIQPYVFNWTSNHYVPGNTNDTLFNQIPGKYYVEVHSAYGNEVVHDSVIIGEPNAIQVATAPYVYPNNFNVSCYHCYNGSITASVISGGYSPFTYSWVTGQSTATITALGKETYTVTVSDINGCTGTHSSILTEAEPETWKMNGDSLPTDTSKFLGTTNYKDLVIKTESIERLRVTKDGLIQLKGDIKIDGAEANTGFNIMYTDQYGKVLLSPGNSGVCNTPSNHWLTNFCTAGSNTYYSPISGNVGIGLTSPSAKLHISGGDVRIDNLSGTGNRMVRVNSQGTLQATSGVAWETLGNSGIGTNDFLGTTDHHDLAFKTNSDVNSNPNMIIKYSNGNVGIGTSDPKENLQIGNKFTFRDDGTNSIIGHNYFYAAGQSTRITYGKASRIMLGDYGDIVMQVAPNNNALTNITWNTGLIINNEGQVGIGTDAPSSKLHVIGQTILDGIVGIGTTNPKENLQIGTKFTFRDDGTNSIIGHNYFYTSGQSKRISSGKASRIMLGDYGDIVMQVAPNDNSLSDITWTYGLTINNAGKVFIGNCNPPASEAYNLYVLGGIRTELLKIDLASQNGWADYVFHPDYKLTTIEDLSEYIKTNKHLPHILTETEVCKEGIDVAEMTSKLLEKIEELTLYVIQLNEKNNELNNKYQDLINKK